jgi:hypothetical protein
MTPWDRKRIHTLALLERGSITLWDGWIVCDPVGDSPALPAVREFAKKYRVNFLDYRSGLWGKPKPNLTIIMPSANVSMRDLITNTRKDGEICVYTLPERMPSTFISNLEIGPPDVFTLPNDSRLGVRPWTRY